MLQGLTTVNYLASDVPAAVAWYADVLGQQPYFSRPVDGPPAYVEFRVGRDADELGIIDARYVRHGSAGGPTGGPSGAVAYWHVDDVQVAVDTLIGKGATVHDPVVVREAGFVTASVVDPFGNIVGLMHSPHWLGED